LSVTGRDEDLAMYSKKARDRAVQCAVTANQAFDEGVRSALLDLSAAYMKRWLSSTWACGYRNPTDTNATRMIDSKLPVYGITRVTPFELRL
jgi:hypothetical protein